MEKLKNNINFHLFSFILKNTQVSFFQPIKTLFCLVAIVGITDFCNFFLVTPRGSKLYQIIPSPSSLMRNPFYCLLSNCFFFWDANFSSLVNLLQKFKQIFDSLHLKNFRIGWHTIVDDFLALLNTQAENFCLLTIAGCSL